MSAGETVGRQFRAWDGALYLCTRYLRREGFWMRVVVESPTLCRRKVGEETCVSERAIGRTFHREPEEPCEACGERAARGQERPDNECACACHAVLPHEQPCECEPCDEQKGLRP